MPVLDPAIAPIVVRETTEQILLTPAADDPRLVEPYTKRAGAHFALGDAASARVDLGAAARAVMSQGGSRLIKTPVERVRTRRLDPLHLLLCEPEPRLVEKGGPLFGLPLLSYYARTAASEIVNEVRSMSSAFRNGAVETPADLTGLAVATYAGAFGLLAAGDKSSARALLKKLEKFLDVVPESVVPVRGGRRFLSGCAALAAIVGRDVSLFHQQARDASELRGEDDTPDLMLLGLVGLAMLETLPVVAEQVVPKEIIGAGQTHRATEVALVDALITAWGTVD
ncbi:MAG: hypothetical protein IV100_06370 [Myxococcales bacterium]|nr:hypothetical protein [Myxococcales bacterium]